MRKTKKTEKKNPPVPNLHPMGAMHGTDKKKKKKVAKPRGY